MNNKGIHAIYNTQYHIVWTPRYRRKLLVNGVKEYLVSFFSFIAAFLLLTEVLFTGNLLAKIILIFLFGISIVGSFAITFSISAGLFPKYTNSASGLMVASANLGMMIFQYVSGYMSEYYSRNSVLYNKYITSFYINNSDSYFELSQEV